MERGFLLTLIGFLLLNRHENRYNLIIFQIWNFLRAFCLFRYQNWKYQWLIGSKLSLSVSVELSSRSLSSSYDVSSFKSYSRRSRIWTLSPLNNWRCASIHSDSSHKWLKIIVKNSKIERIKIYWQKSSFSISMIEKWNDKQLRISEKWDFLWLFLAVYLEMINNKMIQWICKWNEKYSTESYLIWLIRYIAVRTTEI
jgi:hypothetical protein